MHFLRLIVNPLEVFFSIEDHAALDRYPGSGYNTLHLRLMFIVYVPSDSSSHFPAYQATFLLHPSYVYAL